MSILIVLLFLCLIWYYVDRKYRKNLLKDLTSKHVFITGTDSGFGKRLALELDSKGMTVYAGCYTEKGADDLKTKASSRLHVLRIDVTKAETINEAKLFIEKHLPPGQGLWGLVNNAGVFGNVCFDFSTLEEYKELMDINFYGTILVTQTFLPLIKQARGRIVNVVSIFGRGCTGIIPYSCTKFALEPYCDGLRRSMKTFGVHVAIIEPGYFPETGLVKLQMCFDGLERQWQNLPEKTKLEYGEEFKKWHLAGFKLAHNYWPFSSFNKMSMVTDAMKHALTAEHPKARYLCGYDARLYVIVTTFLPDWFLDIIVRIVSSYNKVRSKV